MPKPQQLLITFRSPFEGGFGGSAVHPAGVGRGGFHSKLSTLTRRARPSPDKGDGQHWLPFISKDSGPAPSTSSTPARLTSLPGRFGHISLHGYRLLPAAKVRLSPQRSPLGAEEREAPRPRGPPSRRPSGGSSKRLRSVPSRLGPRS